MGNTQEFTRVSADETTTEHEESKTVLNVRETARELGIHENTVRKLEKRGELKAIRLPGSGFRRFRREDVAELRAQMFKQFAPDTEAPADRDDMPEELLNSSEHYHQH